VVTTDRANTYGLDPIGRLIASQWIAKLAAQPVMSDRDFVDALLTHANADPKSTESLFNLRAGMPVPHDPIVGQMWPDGPKAKWISKWREILAQIVSDPKKATRTVGAASAAQIARRVLLIPEFVLPAGRLEIRYSLAAPTTELTMHYAVMLLLDTSRPFGAQLSRCTHRTCGKFFLAVREHSRGKVRRDYCSKEHFDDETRKKIAERVRKHREKHPRIRRKAK
jgi:hypothetical protein